MIHLHYLLLTLSSDDASIKKWDSSSVLSPLPQTLGFNKDIFIFKILNESIQTSFFVAKNVATFFSIVNNVATFFFIVKNVATFLGGW
jgi:hypothetical protein